MLVIARKVGQTVLIGDNIEVTISAIRGDQVRLAIAAPREITILRREVVEQVEQSNVAAIDSASGVMDAVSPDTDATVRVTPVVARPQSRIPSSGQPPAANPETLE